VHSDQPKPPVPERTTGWVWLVLALALLGELALLAGVGWLGALLGGGRLSVLLAVVGVVAVATLWGLLMAPRSSRRLRDPARLLVELVLFLGTGISLALLGHPVPGVIGTVVAIGVTGLARVVAPAR
jgi:hypothetical protein